MNTYQLSIKETDDLSWAIQAAHDLARATEKDLATLKTKKWYHRILDVVTFSQGSKIQTLKNIETLAKLQEIVARVLVMLSQQNAEISSALRDQSDLLKNLQCQDMALLKAIRKIKYGGTDQLDFGALDPDKKDLLANLLLMADPDAERNNHSRRYITSILSISNSALLDNTYQIDAVDMLNKKEQELLYQMIMIDRYLRDIDFDEDSDIVDNIGISKKRAREIQSAIKTTAANVVPDFFVSYYEKEMEMVNTIEEKGLVFEPETSHQAKCTASDIILKEWKQLEAIIKQLEKQKYVDPSFAIFFYDYELCGCEFPTKAYAIMMVEQELKKAYVPMSDKLNPYANGNLADLAFSHIRASFADAFRALREHIHRFGENTGLYHVALAMEAILDETNILDHVKELLHKELRENTFEYALRGLSYYVGLAEIESDDFQIETGFRRLLEILSSTWSYTLDPDLERDYERILENFAEIANKLARSVLRTDVFSKIQAEYAKLR